MNKKDMQYAIGKKSRAAAASLAAVKYAMLQTVERDELAEIEDVIDRYGSHTGAGKISAFDVLYSRIRYGTAVREYCMYHFWERSDRERAAYIGIPESRHFHHAYTYGDGSLFKNKEKFYGRFGKYFGRKLLSFNAAEDKDAFLDFLRAEGSVIVKPVAEGLGEGVEVFDLKSGGDPEAFFARKIAEGPFVAEEMIRQAEPMKGLHPESVNTIRFATFIEGDKIHRLYAMLRTGMGGEVVDNAAAGGLCADVDVKTGIVRTGGVNYYGIACDAHPDTGRQIKGLQIPEWDALLALGDALAMEVPEQRFVGWDLAYSEDGWVVVEGNHHAAIRGEQMCRGAGLRPVFRAAGIDV